MGIVKLAHTFGARFLQLLERRPLEQELAAQWSKEILAGQLQGLGIIALERVAQHVAKKSAQIDGHTAMLQEAGELARLRILSQPGSEFFPMM